MPSILLVWLLLMALTACPALAQQPGGATEADDLPEAKSEIPARSEGPPLEIYPLRYGDPYLEWDELDAESDWRSDSTSSGLDWYLKSGVVVPFGGGFFEERVNTGWTVQLGVRQPLAAPSSNRVYFAEIGGGFIGNDGGGDSVLTSGTLGGMVESFPLGAHDDHVHPLDDFFVTSLKDLRRGSIHAALGGYFCPTDLNQAEDRRVQFTVRAGGRVGHLRAHFNHTRTSALQTLVDSHVAHGHVESLMEFDSDVDESDTFWGLFGSLGAEVVCYDVRWGAWSWGDVAIGVEVEMGHDWFDLGDYGESDRGLGTLAAMVTLTFFR